MLKHSGERLIIFTLNNRTMLLRPFTVDQHGQFGPLTYLTLYGKPGPHMHTDHTQRLCKLGWATTLLNTCMLHSAKLPPSHTNWTPSESRQTMESRTCRSRKAPQHLVVHRLLSCPTPKPMGRTSHWMDFYNERHSHTHACPESSRYFCDAVRCLRAIDPSAKVSSQPEPVPGYSKYSSLTPRPRSRLHTPSSRHHYE